MSQTTLLGTPETRAQLADLQSKLEARKSTVNFARSALGMMLAVIAGGTAGKLFWDARDFPYAGIAAGVVAFGLALFSVINYGVGRKHLRIELQLFAALKELRHALRLDDPLALLPLVQ